MTSDVSDVPDDAEAVSTPSSASTGEVLLRLNGGPHGIHGSDSSDVEVSEPTKWTSDGEAIAAIASTHATSAHEQSDPHAEGTCRPCVFFLSRYGCTRGKVCQYCHRHDDHERRLPHRPRKQTRDKVRRLLTEALARCNGRPETMQDELQQIASDSVYARNLLAGSLDRMRHARPRQRSYDTLFL
ncbi:unnamed protein product [Symbiodinium natans]|uniref:C3H1-type domain-containing protein n=1 Tax=Symbiodinium natans TaxID=878477 RepID=A0A812JDF3_9DINO|nr:unnamed protein product [Symbiodinium natans]